MCGTNAVAWAVGATTANSSLPSWPAYVFGVMTLAALYVLGAALGRKWPFHRLALAPAELLDDCIRRGRDARARIIHERLDDWEVAGEAAAWTLRTANLLHEQFPSVADEFLAANGNEEQLSGQALAVRTLAVKLAVLAAARRELVGSPATFAGLGRGVMALVAKSCGRDRYSTGRGYGRQGVVAGDHQ